MTALERKSVELVRDMVRVASSPAADFAEDGVDERLFAARIEGLCKQTADITHRDVLPSPKSEQTRRRKK